MVDKDPDRPMCGADTISDANPRVFSEEFNRNMEKSVKALGEEVEKYILSTVEKVLAKSAKDLSESGFPVPVPEPGEEGYEAHVRHIVEDIMARFFGIVPPPKEKEDNG